MGKIYARTIMRGPLKLSEVPDRWYDATVEALRELCDEETFDRIMDEANG